MISPKAKLGLAGLISSVKSFKGTFWSTESRDSRYKLIANKALSDGGVSNFKLFGYSLWCISDPIILRSLLLDVKSNLKKGNVLTLLSRLLGHSLLTAEGPEWEALSNSSKLTLGNKNSQSYRSRVVDVVENWIRDQQSQHTDELVLNLRDDLYFLSMDIMSSVLLGCLLPENTKKSIYVNQEWIQTTIKSRIGSSLMMPTWIPSPSFIQVFFAKLRIDRMLSPWVRKARYISSEFGNCLLSDLDAEIRGKALCPFTDKQHKDFVKTLFFAGIRTTALTLEWIILYLISHPDWLKEIQEEIDKAPEPNKLSFSCISRLGCLEKFISEVMRIRPIVHTYVRVVKNSFECNNYQFRSGEILFLSAYGLNHDTNLWEEPDRFSPDRFINKAFASSMFPFGLGKHTCPGRFLAYQDIAIVIVSLLHRYKVKSTAIVNLDPCSGFLLEPSIKQSVELVER